jgi:diacylglycerol kinase family enzyme
MVRLREAEQERLGRSKRLAMLSASLSSLRSFRRHKLWISAEGIEERVRTPLLFVGNNRYQVNLLSLGQRERIDGGELCLYAVKAKSRAHLFWAGIRGIFGRLEQQRDFVIAYPKDAEIASDRPVLAVSVDGETVRMETPLRYRIRAGALTILAPAEA